MTAPPPRSRLDALMDRLDAPLIALAILSVGVYLLELLGVFRPGGAHRSVMLAFDVIFVLDLFARLASQRRYLQSPWFTIDLLSTLPALAWITGEGLIGPGLRFIRLLRVLRTMRLLRTTRTLDVIGAIPEDTSLTSPRVRRGLSLLTVLYALALIGLSHQIHALAATAQQARFMEATLLLGALMGTAMTLALLQLQIPELATARIKAVVQVALPGQIADRLLSDPDVYHRTTRQPATVIFCDIVGFTQTVERLDGDLAALKTHLERALDVVTDQHRRHDLVIDKFIGDAVMSFRGGELVTGTPAEHAAAVVRAALDARSALLALDDPYFGDIKIGGASSEAALIGSFGTARRLTYTVLGDRVNLAARLESAVKQCGTSNLFCARTHALTADHPDIRWRRFGWVKVSGKVEAVEVFEALDPSREADWAWVERFHAALAHFEAGALSEAAAGFAAADAAREGGDRASQRYRERAIAGEGGVFRTEK